MIEALWLAALQLLQVSRCFDLCWRHGEGLRRSVTFAVPSSVRGELSLPQTKLTQVSAEGHCKARWPRPDRVWTSHRSGQAASRGAVAAHQPQRLNQWEDSVSASTARWCLGLDERQDCFRADAVEFHRIGCSFGLHHSLERIHVGDLDD